MATKLLKQLQGSQKFLTGLTSLPTYVDVRAKQQAVVDRTLAEVESCTTQEATNIITAISPALWEESWLTSVKATVAALPEKDTTRAVLQDYRALLHLLTEDIWVMLRDEGTTRVAALDSLTHHAARLGLRHPTEGTLAVMMALLWAFRRDQPSAGQKLELLHTNRARVKKLLQAYPGPAAYLMVLPHSREELPELLFQSAFQTGAPVPAQSVGLVLGVASTWPLRKTNAAAASSASSSNQSTGQAGKGLSPRSVGQMIVALATGMSGARAQSEPHIEILAPAGHKQQQQQPEQLLALEDEPRAPLVHAQPQVAAAAATAPGSRESLQVDAAPAPTAAGVVSDLRSALRGDGAEERALRKPAAAREVAAEALQEEPAEHVLGEPAAGKTQGPAAQVLKRPSARMQEPAKHGLGEPSARKMQGQAALALKRPSACLPGTLKRPAAAAAEPDSRTAKRQALLKAVPKSQLLKYPNGCAKCRGREFCTTSCWRARGFDL